MAPPMDPISTAYFPGALHTQHRDLMFPWQTTGAPSDSCLYGNVKSEAGAGGPGGGLLSGSSSPATALNQPPVGNGSGPGSCLGSVLEATMMSGMYQLQSYPKYYSESLAACPDTFAPLGMGDLNQAQAGKCDYSTVTSSQRTPVDSYMNRTDLEEIEQALQPKQQQQQQQQLKLSLDAPLNGSSVASLGQLSSPRLRNGSGDHGNLPDQVLPGVFGILGGLRGGGERLRGACSSVQSSASIVLGGASAAMRTDESYQRSTHHKNLGGTRKNVCPPFHCFPRELSDETSLEGVLPTSSTVSSSDRSMDHDHEEEQDNAAVSTTSGASKPNSSPLFKIILSPREAAGIRAFDLSSPPAPTRPQDEHKQQQQQQQQQQQHLLLQQQMSVASTSDICCKPDQMESPTSILHQDHHHHHQQDGGRPSQRSSISSPVASPVSPISPCCAATDDSLTLTMNLNHNSNNGKHDNRPGHDQEGGDCDGEDNDELCNLNVDDDDPEPWSKKLKESPSSAGVLGMNATPSRVDTSPSYVMSNNIFHQNLASNTATAAGPLLDIAAATNINTLGSSNDKQVLAAVAKGSNRMRENFSNISNMTQALLFRASFPAASMDLAAVENSRPKRRNVKISKDPQSVAARHRRERISDRIRVLQRLVPGGTKMDTASMLDEAIHYVKFLKAQVQNLESVSNGTGGFDPRLAYSSSPFFCNSIPFRPPSTDCTSINSQGLPSSGPEHSLYGVPTTTHTPFINHSSFPESAVREQFCH